MVGWIGYPLVGTLLAKRRPAPRLGRIPTDTTVSVIIASRDAPDIIAHRVRDILKTDYPRELLEVIVAVDATALNALNNYHVALLGSASIVPGDEPGGKAAALNAGVRHATGEVLVFADSRQSFAPDAIPRLVEFLGGGGFGAASGTLVLAPERYDRTVLGLFWQYELHLRRVESAIHSIVGVSGAIYALERSLWTPVPANLICDDLFVPLTLAMDGHRVGHCEEARAFDPRHFGRKEEFRRRVRTLTGVLQLCAWRPAILSPWQNPVWIQFTCHKLLRIVTPYLVLIAVVGLLPWMLRCIPQPWFLWLAATALLAIIGLSLIRPAATRWLASQVVWVVWLHAVPIKASLNAFRRDWNVW